MSDVSFEEPDYRYKPSTLSKHTGLAGFLIRKNIVTDERSAQYVMIGASVAALLLAAYLLFNPGKTSVRPVPPLLPPVTSLPAPSVR